MFKIYIASPYSKGDTAINVKRQIDVANDLMDNGFAPFAPLYYHFQHLVHPRQYDDWVNVDLAWVKVCDGLIRLKGESNGADMEVMVAKENDIPVFYSIDSLIGYFRDHSNMD